MGGALPRGQGPGWRAEATTRSLLQETADGRSQPKQQLQILNMVVVNGSCRTVAQYEAPEAVPDPRRW
jgi:hypothetical protein